MERRPLEMHNGAWSTTRLGRLHDVLAGHVERGNLPGLVALVDRRGEVHADAIGATAVDGTTPMRRDTIFRIASVTKPIVAAAAMILVEECVLRLDDPVDPFLPELAERQVLQSLESPLDDTVPANRPLTLRDLLTFRAGYGAVMVFPPRYPIQEAMAEAGVAPGPDLPVVPPDELMRRYGGLPLMHQPGEQWLYDSGSDILGVLIARAAGQSLGEFLRDRIFTPLGMTDTGFHVPAAKLDRLASFYRFNPETDTLDLIDGVADSTFAEPPVFESGAGGLVSTVDDLHAFGRMMLRQGRFGEQRILSRPSVTLMTTDQISPAQKAASPFVPGFWDHRGWGFGVSIITQRDDLAGTPGRYGWDGGYGTSWYVDPSEEVIGILMTQRLLDDPAGPTAFSDFWTATYQAIAD